MPPRRRTSRTLPKKAGRPPAGDQGEKVSDYTRTSFWLPPRTRETINLMARVLDRPQWRIVCEAMDELAARLPADKRKALDVLRRLE